MPWNEEEVNNVLINLYGWSADEESTTTWRLGDGTTPLQLHIFFKKDLLRMIFLGVGKLTKD